MSGLFNQTAKGLKWTTFSSIAMVISQFTLGILLARLLSPKEFGLIAMVTVVISYASILINFGLGTVLVQRNIVSPSQFSSAFWLNLIISIVLFFIFLACAPLLAEFYDVTIVKRLTWWLAPIVLINAIGICHKAKLEREINLKPVALSELFSVLVGTITAIIMAFNGFGVWSLVAQALIKSVVYNVILVGSTRWWPSLVFRINDLKPLLSFSGGVLTNQLAEGAAGNVDRILVGKFAGSEDLGAFEKAKNLMILPTMMIGGILSKVILPSLSLIQKDLKKFGQSILEISALLGFLIFPVMSGLQIIAPELIPLLFGAQWTPMIQLFQIICWAGWFTVLNILLDNVVISSGNQRGLWNLTLVEKPFMIVIFILGIFWGAKGVAVAYVLGAGLMFFYKLYIATKPLNIGFFTVLKTLVPAVTCTLAMYLFIIVFSNAVPLTISPWFRIFYLVSLGIISYALLSWWFQKKTVNYFIRILSAIGK